MIFLSVVTPQGAQLAVKTASGILVLAEARARFPEAGLPLPQTLDSVLAEPSGLERVRSYVATLLSRPEGLEGLMRPAEEVHIGLLFRPRNIICQGRNYAAHVEEGGNKPPGRPMLFAKLSGCVIGPHEPILLPLDSVEVDYEAELAVVLGRTCRRVPAGDALDYVAGYTCLNDVSARDFQRNDGQWMRAKSQDTFAPMGPYLVSREEIPDPQDLAIRCWVNGELRQDSNTSKMIFPVRELIAYISRGMTLEPGDVISTGTPHGIGAAMKPPRFLKDGDEVVVEVERVGRLVNTVRKSV
jgi:2-keto-4-pentenoate hydratase/2-oxohepta-3-ene-1,7-dioic acid hydratase in catechol pathway